MTETVDQKIERIKADAERERIQEYHDKYVFSYPAYDQTKLMVVNTDTGVVKFSNSHYQRIFQSEFCLIKADVLAGILERLDALESRAEGTGDSNGRTRRGKSKSDNVSGNGG